MGRERERKVWKRKSKVQSDSILVVVPRIGLECTLFKKRVGIILASGSQQKVKKRLSFSLLFPLFSSIRFHDRNRRQSTKTTKATSDK